MKAPRRKRQESRVVQEGEPVSPPGQARGMKSKAVIMALPHGGLAALRCTRVQPFGSFVSIIAHAPDAFYWNNSCLETIDY
jgi:hypothetical protein